MAMEILDGHTTTVLMGVFAVLVVFHFVKKIMPSGNLPPGPKGIPLYGNALTLKKWDAKGPGILDKWAKEFGDIYSIKLGKHPTIVLNSPELVRDVLVKHGDKTSGRSTNVFFFNTVMAITNKGIGLNEGQHWKDLRRTTLHCLRDFGMGKKSLEQRIQEEARALVDHLDSIGDGPLDPRHALHNVFSNVIFSIVFGERYEYDDPEFNHLSDLLAAVFGGGGFKNPEMFQPFLLPVMPLTNLRLMKTIKANTQLQDALKRKIKEHRGLFDPDDIKSFVDIYLNAERNGEFANPDTEVDLFFTILDLFFAGSETSTTTLRWTILYFIHNPHVQEKCQMIIKDVIGQEKIPSGSDREKMPYVEATMYEIQRLANIAPYAVLHRVEETLDILDYTIPKDTLIIPNLHYIHKNPKYWNDPERFDPERWINVDGKLMKHEAFMPFGVGPRECLGKSLALQEMFIVLVSLLQKFTFKAKDAANLPKIAGEVGIVHVPFAYEICVARW